MRWRFVDQAVAVGTVEKRYFQVLRAAMRQCYDRLTEYAEVKHHAILVIYAAVLYCDMSILRVRQYPTKLALFYANNCYKW